MQKIAYEITGTIKEAWGGNATGTVNGRAEILLADTTDESGETPTTVTVTTAHGRARNRATIKTTVAGFKDLDAAIREATYKAEARRVGAYGWIEGLRYTEA